MERRGGRIRILLGLIQRLKLGAGRAPGGHLQSSPVLSPAQPQVASLCIKERQTDLPWAWREM